MIKNLFSEDSNPGILQREAMGKDKYEEMGKDKYDLENQHADGVMS